MNIRKNPYAFARPVTEEGCGQEGMTLRDFFAAHALTGMMRHRSADEEARIAYEIADAMLKERGKNAPREAVWLDEDADAPR